jgi:hypothetical protein
MIKPKIRTARALIFNYLGQYLPLLLLYYFNTLFLKKNHFLLALAGRLAQYVRANASGIGATIITLEEFHDLFYP